MRQRSGRIGTLLVDVEQNYAVYVEPNLSVLPSIMMPDQRGRLCAARSCEELSLTAFDPWRDR